MNDIKISEDGDFVLGLPKLDSNGQVLYEDGKPVVDLDLVSGVFSDKQMIFERLKTEKMDWYIFENIGNTLNDLIGQPNTRETADRGVAIINEALSYDGFVSSANVEINAVPVNTEEIVYIVKIKIKNNEYFNVFITLNLVKGVQVNVG